MRLSRCFCAKPEDDISSWSNRRGLAREFKNETKALQVCRLLNQRGGPHGIARVMKWRTAEQRDEIASHDVRHGGLAPMPISAPTGPRSVYRTLNLPQSGGSPDSRKFMRLFKRIICADISEFESYMPSHAVGSLQCQLAAVYEELASTLVGYMYLPAAESPAVNSMEINRRKPSESTPASVVWTPTGHSEACTRLAYGSH